MGNLCLNHLIVYGQSKEIKEFYEDCRLEKSFSKALDFSFAPLAPLSPEDNGNGKKTWGTKADADVQFLDVSSKEGICTFETVWTPPVTWIEKIAALYPHLHFILSFHECGNQLAGYIEAQNGIANYHECADWEEYVHFIYSGEPEHSFQFDRSCLDCCNVEVSVEDIVKHKDILCHHCHAKKEYEGGVAS
ncbi:MAG: hypothetical protein R3267_11860 [Paenisporosarcina sp.]|nr:hypothetical protein [Paenisporosarcina sp.]